MLARAGLDLLAGHDREVVGDLQGAEALRTGVERAQVDLVAALAAAQGGGVPERPLAQGVLGDVFSATAAAHVVLLLIFPGTYLAPGRI